MTSTDRGSSALFFAVLAPALFAIIGLVLDGGREIVNREHAASVALSAARFAVGRCDPTAFRLNLGCEVQDTPALRQAIVSFVQSQASAADEVPQVTSITPGNPDPQRAGYFRSFAVGVQVTFHPILLDIVPGFSTLSVESTQSAQTFNSTTANP